MQNVNGQPKPENVKITLLEGYKLKFIGPCALVMKEDGSEPPYLIPMVQVKPGDYLPRITDKPIKWDM